MRIARIAAFSLTGLCLVVAVLTLMMPTKSTFRTGAESYSWTCGSAAFPKSSAEFDRMDDIVNCTGATPASTALYAVILATFGLGVAALASWRIKDGATTESSRPRPQPGDRG